MSYSFGFTLIGLHALPRSGRLSQKDLLKNRLTTRVLRVEVLGYLFLESNPRMGFSL